MTTEGKTWWFNLTFAVNVKRATKVVCYIFQKISVKSGWKVSGTRLSGRSNENFPGTEHFREQRNF